MADSPQNQPVDPDALTDKVVQQALANVLTWEEWLAQNQFIKGEKHRSAISAVEWNRDFPKFGRGWRMRVAPATDTINIIVYNGLFSRKASQIAMVSVSERSVVSILTKLITEIERPVSDGTKKRRIRVITSAIPYEERDEKPEFMNGPVMTPDNLQQLRSMGLMRQQEAGPIRRPIPDDPNELNREQMGQMFDRLQSRCFQKGQRVRVRTERQTRLNGEMGTVVDAGPHSCYVAIDSYVEAGDPDPFRFEEQELEPVFESAEDLDAPGPYMAALDYLTPLKQLGYSGPSPKWGLLDRTYRKRIRLDQRIAGFAGQSVAGYLHIIVHPKDVRAIVYIDYQSEGERERIQSIEVDALEVIDVVRELEQLVAQSQSVSEFAAKLQQRNFPRSTPVTQVDRLIYLFGESAPDDVDDPQRYFQELQRHAEVINAFREHGVRMRRRMQAARPYYSMFWHPSAVTGTNVTYDIYLEPDGTGWRVSAQGLKNFHHEMHGDFEEEFDIEPTWTIPAGAAGEELVVEVDNILSAISAYQGPEEPTASWYPADLDENVDDGDITDYANYAKDSANWNIIKLITSKDLRNIIREAGFKVSTIYRSRMHHGWSVSAIPATAQAFEQFQKNPYRMAEYLEHELRDGLIKRFPELGKITQGQYVFDQKLKLHCWEWAGATSEHPENPNNWVVYADILPIDWEKRGRGGKMLEAVENSDASVPAPPEDDLDAMAYVKDTLVPDDVLRELGYEFEPEGAHAYWRKQIDDKTKFIVFLSDENFEFTFQLYEHPAGEFWQLRGSYAGVPLRKLKASLMLWEQRVKEGVLNQSFNLSRLVSEGIDDTGQKWAYRGITLDQFKRLIKTGWMTTQPVLPEQASYVGKRVVWFTDNYENTRNYGEWITVRFPWPDGAEQYSDEEWVVNRPVPVDQLEVETDNYAGWVPVRQVRLIGQTIVGKIGEGIDDPDSPDMVLAVHKPRGYALYGQYTNYDQPISFSTFKTLPEALAAAKLRDLHNEYDYVWADELEFDSLEKWDSGETMACKYTGIKYRITPEYELERVKHPDAVSGAPPIAESEDDVDVEAYVKTTYDPLEFLRSQGWNKLKVDYYEYWHKDWPLPRSYRLGGMTFTKLRVLVGFNPQFRGASAAAVHLYWSDGQDRAFPVQGWNLDPQRVYPEEDESISAKVDFDMPLRRFVRGIEKVLDNVAWPESSAAVLHANSHLEAEVGRFVQELNQQAETPLYPERPMEEAVVS